MIIAEWDAEKAYQYARKEGLEDGRAEGRVEGLVAGRAEGLVAGREEGLVSGRAETQARVASDMLKDNYPLSAIQKISKLSEEAIRNLANSLGITIA